MDECTLTKIVRDRIRWALIRAAWRLEHLHDEISGNSLVDKYYPILAASVLGWVRDPLLLQDSDRDYGEVLVMPLPPLRKTLKALHKTIESVETRRRIERILGLPDRPGGEALLLLLEFATPLCEVWLRLRELLIVRCGIANDHAHVKLLDEGWREYVAAWVKALKRVRQLLADHPSAVNHNTRRVFLTLVDKDFLERLKKGLDPNKACAPRNLEELDLRKVVRLLASLSRSLAAKSGGYGVFAPSHTVFVDALAPVSRASASWFEEFQKVYRGWAMDAMYRKGFTGLTAAIDARLDPDRTLRNPNLKEAFDDVLLAVLLRWLMCYAKSLKVNPFVYCGALWPLVRDDFGLVVTNDAGGKPVIQGPSVTSDSDLISLLAELLEADERADTGFGLLLEQLKTVTRDVFCGDIGNAGSRALVWLMMIFKTPESLDKYLEGLNAPQDFNGRIEDSELIEALIRMNASPAWVDLKETWESWSQCHQKLPADLKNIDLDAALRSNLSQAASRIRAEIWRKAEKFLCPPGDSAVAPASE